VREGRLGLDICTKQVLEVKFMTMMRTLGAAKRLKQRKEPSTRGLRAMLKESGDRDKEKPTT
jgi:hypothetical protein